MFLQLMSDTTISANWVIAGAVSIAVFLLWRILSKMERKLETHDTEINEVKTDVALLKANKETSETIASGIVKALKREPSVKYP
jgi:hypothetical protein